MASPTTDPGAAPTISIIVPSYRQTDVLRETLRRLADQSIPRESYEVIVGDNSRDEEWCARVADVCRELGSQYVRCDRPGAGAARNEAVRASRGGILLFVDDDVLVSKDFLESHMALHNKDENIVVVGAIVQRPKRDTWFSRYLIRTDAIHRSPSREVEPVYGQFYGVNSSVRKRWVEHAGMFDEAFVRRQDGELAYRLYIMGLRFVAETNAPVEHCPNFSFTEYLSRSPKNGYYYRRLIEKHPELAREKPWWFDRPWVRVPFAAVGWALFPVGFMLLPISPWLLDRALNGIMLSKHIRGYLQAMRDSEISTEKGDD